MVLKTISSGCGVRAFLMLFLDIVITFDPFEISQVNSNIAKGFAAYYAIQVDNPATRTKQEISACERDLCQLTLCFELQSTSECRKKHISKQLLFMQ